MTAEQLSKILEALKTGKIYIQSDIDYGYGDRSMTVIQYHPLFKEFRWEVYALHANGEELTRTEIVDPKNLRFSGEYEEVMTQMVDRKKYPWV